MVEFHRDLLGGYKYKTVFETWFNQPEFRPLIIVIIGICVTGAIVFWWLKNRNKF